MLANWGSHHDINLLRVHVFQSVVIFANVKVLHHSTICTTSTYKKIVVLAESGGERERKCRIGRKKAPPAEGEW